MGPFEKVTKITRHHDDDMLSPQLYKFWLRSASDSVSCNYGKTEAIGLLQSYPESMSPRITKEDKGFDIIEIPQSVASALRVWP